MATAERPVPQMLNARDLVGVHGVPLEEAAKVCAHTEGLESLDFDSSSCKFRWSEKDERVYISIPERQDLELDISAWEKAMRIAGFPTSVVNNYPAELMVVPLNWGFPGKIGHVRAFVKNGRLIAFTKPSAEITSIRQLLEIVAEVGGPETLFERLDHNLQFTNCSAIRADKWRSYDDDRVQELLLAGGHQQIKGKDVLIGGVNFSTSVMAEHPLEISAYVYRLICSNGLMSAEQTWKWSRNIETQNSIEWFREHITSAFELLDNEFDKIDHLKHEKIDPGARAEVLANVFSEYHLSDKMRRLVLERVTDEPPRDMFDVLQAVTNVVNDEEVATNPLQVRHLQKIGGDIVSRASICPACHAVRRS